MTIATRCGKGLSIDVQKITDRALLIDLPEKEAILQVANELLNANIAERQKVIDFVVKKYNARKPKQENVKKNAKVSSESVTENTETAQENESELVKLFKSFKKNSGFEKGTESKLEGQDNAELIRNVQNNWADVLMDHAFEQDKENGIKGRVTQTILMNGC